MRNNTGKTPVAISAGLNFSLVLMSDGTVFGCGANSWGQLGIDNTTFTIRFLTQMTNTTGKTPLAISAGWDFSLVLMSDGTVFGCGSNSYGQLGIGTTVGTNFYKKVLTQMKSPDGNGFKSLDGSVFVSNVIALNSTLAVVPIGTIISNICFPAEPEGSPSSLTLNKSALNPNLYAKQ